MRRKPAEPSVVAAVSGGPDSVFLLDTLLREGKRKVLVGHVNHGLRGRASDKDQELVERIAETHRLELRVRKEKPGKIGKGLEEKARKVRYEFLGRLARESGAIVATAHTADDQVETILMRFFEGSGIAGLKGIPRESTDGIVRPILDIWKEDILEYLKRNNIPFRVDRSNLECLHERNWIRNVLLPLLVKRYGKPVKRRIFTMGERFRELDDYLGSEAARWIRRNVNTTPASAVIPRKGYRVLPTVLRVRILQVICFGSLGSSPNERLLAAMDRSVCTGKPSGRVKVGKGWELANRYGESRFVLGGKPVRKPFGRLRVESLEGVTPARARRISARGNAEAFDSDALRLPLSVRPLREGDRILPFGGRSGEKKLKEILIDRKVPAEERWGRPVVCDPEGTILWVPGLLRSGHAPVTTATRCAKILIYITKPEETNPIEPVL